MWAPVLARTVFEPNLIGSGILGKQFSFSMPQFPQLLHVELTNIYLPSL